MLFNSFTQKEVYFYTFILLYSYNYFTFILEKSQEGYIGNFGQKEKRDLQAKFLKVTKCKSFMVYLLAKPIGVVHE
jgi:hypothetical protein